MRSRLESLASNDTVFTGYADQDGVPTKFELTQEQAVLRAMARLDQRSESSDDGILVDADFNAMTSRIDISPEAVRVSVSKHLTTGKEVENLPFLVEELFRSNDLIWDYPKESDRQLEIHLFWNDKVDTSSETRIKTTLNRLLERYPHFTGGVTLRQTVRILGKNFVLLQPGFSRGL